MLETLKDYPNNIEAETMFISQIMMDDSLIFKILDINIKPEDFFVNDYQKIYSVILKLIQNKKTVDIITIKEKSGIKISDEVIFKALSTSGFVDYAKIIKEKSIKRNILRKIKDVEKKSIDEKSQIEDIQKEIDETLSLCITIEKEKTFNEELIGYYEELFDEPKNKIKTNYDCIDNKYKFSKGELIIIAGRPGVGKSAVMACFALKMQGVAFFSIEMSKREIAYRMSSIVSGVPLSVINNGIKNQPENISEKINKSFETILGKGMYVYDKKNTILSIKMEIKRLKILYNINAVFIDYLQIVKPEDYHINRSLQIGQMSSELKQLALELDICIIVGSQLNREIEKRVVREPKLSDLRESGSIEQDADRVIFIDRNEEENPGIISLIIAKNRNGKVGKVNMEYAPTRLTMFNKELENSF